MITDPLIILVFRLGALLLGVSGVAFSFSAAVAGRRQWGHAIAFAVVAALAFGGAILFLSAL